VQRDWQAQVQLQANLPVQTLDWPQAVTRVRTGNLKLRAARPYLRGQCQPAPPTPVTHFPIFWAST